MGLFNSTVISAFFACFDSQTRVRFEQIKTNSKCHEKKQDFLIHDWIGFDSQVM